ncbi:MAG: four helix bundle protein [Armatimonadetes bacterium]|nr:four helix bundle protein [Armatimonadota bacterium]
MGGRGGADGITDYKDLNVWRTAMELSEAVYHATRPMPDEEKFGLTSQMRRAAISIPANIAEGYGRGSRTDYLRFVKMARGSAAELETELLLAQRLGFLDAARCAHTMDLLQQVRRLIQGLVRALASD